MNYSYNYSVKIKLAVETFDILDNYNFSTVLPYNSDSEWRMEDHVPSNTKDTELELPQSVDPLQEKTFWAFESALLSLICIYQICGSSFMWQAILKYSHG